MKPEIDIQSFVLSAERTAEELVKKHDGNLIEIKKEVARIGIPRVRGFDFREEILWAANWLSNCRLVS